MKHNARFELRLPELLLARLEAYAARQGETVAEVVRRAAQEALEAERRTPAPR
jgi:metal-responsive CopG/Arc/MetJ family transcriptional regulator